jgi:uncharacterized membrane protein YphA (DoxX/SURF4 family)
VEGWFFLVAALLIYSGIRKLADPDPTAGALRAAHLPATRLAAYAIGLIEVGVGTMALLTEGWWWPWLVAAVYLGFAGFVGVALRRRLPIASCGCFGKADTPPTWIHLVLNLAAAAGAVIVGSRPPASLPSILEEQPLLGLPYLGFLLVGVYALYLILSELPRLRTR